MQKRYLLLPAGSDRPMVHQYPLNNKRKVPQYIYTILEVQIENLILEVAQTCLTSCCQPSHFPPAEAICSACLSDKTCLKHILLTYKGFRRAKGTGCNWCQRGAKRQWFIARWIWLARNCHNYLLPPRSHPDCALFHQPNTHTHTHFCLFFYKCCSCLSGRASVSSACLVHLKGH